MLCWHHCCKIPAGDRAGRQAGSFTPRCPASLHSPAAARGPSGPFGARCCAEGGGSPEGCDGVCSPCPVQAARCPRAELSTVPTLWQGGSGTWGLQMVPMASGKPEMGSACVIHTEEITPSLSDPNSFQHPSPSPLSSGASPAFHLLPKGPSPQPGGTGQRCQRDPSPAEPQPAPPAASVWRGLIERLVKPSSTCMAAEGEDGFPGPPSLCWWLAVFLRGLYLPADGFSRSPRALPHCLSSCPRAGCNEKCAWLPILEWEVKAKKPETSAPQRVGCG